MTDGNAIRGHLMSRFEKHRIVIWRDPDNSYLEELDTYVPDGVELLVVKNTEFAIKHRALRENPTERFLVYRGGEVSDGTGNWLLDLELAFGTFTADRVALLIADLGLVADGAGELIGALPAFFRNAKLVDKLRVLLKEDDDLLTVQAKMCAVLLKQKDHSFTELTRTLLVEHAAGNSTSFDAITERGLNDFHWAGARSIYGYESEEPSMAGFVHWMFQRAAEGFEVSGSNRARNLAIDFRRFRDSKRSGEAMKVLARTVEHNLDYSQGLVEIEWTDLQERDIFEATEREIIGRLVEALRTQTVPHREIVETINVRRSDSFWFEDYETIYDGLNAAAELLFAIRTSHFEISTFDDGITRYRDEWYRIDQMYRHFTQAYLTAEYQQPLDALAEHVENAYVNDFVAKLGINWQTQVDSVDRWRSVAVPLQTAFYDRHVAKLMKGRKKAVVVISDALRYEVAEEFATKMRGEKTYDAKIEAMLGVLPSYTQLGMAALLPHTTLSHSPAGTPVLADGHRTDGTLNRNKILQAVGGGAVQAKDFIEMKAADRRALLKSHQVLYVYHDTIDATGDSASSERRTFAAAAEAVRELIDLMKKLTSANATNILVTADHGFLYQRTKLAPQFNLTVKPQGDQIVVEKRRYALGRGLKNDDAFRTFLPEQLGLSDDLEVQIPNSICRIVQPGAGFQFVHGGAALQEIVIPVVTVNKNEKHSVEPVDVDIHPESNKITTGQVVVKLEQLSKVEPHRPPRRLRAGLYFGDLLISEEQEMIFDSESSEGRDRFRNVTLLLSKAADAANNQNVEFRLSQPIDGTDQWKKYKSAPYVLKRTFVSDDGWDF